MVEWCNLAAYVLAALAQVVLTVSSLFLDGEAWWENLPGRAKVGIYAGLCVVLGLLAWYAGYEIGCTDWPPLASALYVIAVAAFGFFANGYRHERAQGH